MDKFALSASLQSRPGKESEVEQFLKSAEPLVMEEVGTTTWYAFKSGDSAFGIFDTFATEEARDEHLNGAVAKALMQRAEELFATPPTITKLEILASKEVKK